MLNKRKGLLLTALASTSFLLAACGGGAVNENADTAADTATETVTAASISDQPQDLVEGLGENGNWIFAATADIEVSEDVTVSGTFHDGGDESADEFRKLALYAQDDDRNVTEEYTLTVPTLIVESPNFRIQNGTVAGDIQVNAEGFELVETTVEGNVTFSSQELMDAANIEEGTVNGEVTVAE